ncbi:lytic transglycosylase domain-containing protein [Rhodococcus zopfii]|uniref:lytic transglycosylase domain-containing protein n=1 Tax=Rhodococcus zopfii TaxID=43772 RepID=UPI0011110E28|nr:lytic murein transglycosylase [Rhodococcus zopfii]
MGRHNKATTSKLRRNSVIAVTGLVPVGLVAAAATTAGAASKSILGIHQTAETADVEAAAGTGAGNPKAIQSVAPVADLMTAPEPAAAPAPKAAPEPEPAAPAVRQQGPLGIPAVNFAAYQNAERILAAENPGCGMYWTLLAGIGRVESGHANGGRAADDGNLFEPVIGLPLDGSLRGQATIRDTDGGALDGDTVYDRAVGPMQFIPTTWNQYAGDGNGDGVADPQNLFDSTLTTAKYLCDGGLDMRNVAQATKAIHRYNNSMAYVANVLAWSAAYSTGIEPSPVDLPRIH